MTLLHYLWPRHTSLIRTDDWPAQDVIWAFRRGLPREWLPAGAPEIRVACVSETSGELSIAPFFGRPLMVVTMTADVSPKSVGSEIRCCTDLDAFSLLFPVMWGALIGFVALVALVGTDWPQTSPSAAGLFGNLLAFIICMSPALIFMLVARIRTALDHKTLSRLLAFVVKGRFVEATP